MHPMSLDLDHYMTFGFMVLRGWFDPEALGRELDHALSTGLPAKSAPLEKSDIRFQYVPMMTSECPESLALLDRCGHVAEELLGHPVLPTRAKGCRYSGGTPWHVDSTLDLPSVGFAAYLEPLGTETGALRVLPGSHLPASSKALQELGAQGLPAPSLPGLGLQTEPGDLIAFDEHLWHASAGGTLRRQWRADYVGAPENTSAEERVKAYFQGIFPPDRDGGYDVDRYPSYGPDWRQSPRPSAARLDVLGVYDLADRQEAYARSKRQGMRG